MILSDKQMDLIQRMYWYRNDELLDLSVNEKITLTTLWTEIKKGNGITIKDDKTIKRLNKIRGLYIKHVCM